MKINFAIFKFMRYSVMCLLLIIGAFSLFAAEPAESKFSAVREECEKLLKSESSPQEKSIAHIRIAQSYQAEKRLNDAIAEYEKIRDNNSYPEVHRFEAEEIIKEIKRTIKGLPPRDPAATPVIIPEIKVAKEFFIAVNGSDDNNGTKEKPLKTIEKARDAIREIKDKGLLTGSIAVTLLPGEYQIKNTIGMNAADGGTKEHPVIYRAEKKGTVKLYGGSRLSGFKPVTDEKMLARLPEEARGKVYQCDMKALGITDYGKLQVRGFGQPASPPTMELYFNGKPMTLARWPNEGFVKIKKLAEPGEKGIKPSVIEYDSPRHERWTSANDLWLFGYFKYLWADATIKIANIDVNTKTMTTTESYSYGGTGMNAVQGIIYYAFNLLEEIDKAGEWYLDRTNGMLYLWPPSDPAQATIETGLLSVPMISINKAANIRIEGITFDLARYNGIVINDCENCVITGVMVKRFAGNGITINGGKQCGIASSDIYTIGRRATEVIGGNRETLTPGEHFVENCRIFDFGRIDRTYTPAIQMEGVGNRAAHNEMYDSPSSVMRIEGNDHIIEFNYVHDAVKESDDQGSMELFGNPTYRGVIFRYNKFCNIGKTGSEHAVHGQAAIRFDDTISGMQVYSNIFYRASNGNFGAIQINSGRDNIIDNNIIVECKKSITGRWNPGNNMWQQIYKNNAPRNVYSNDLYISTYPAIANMMDNKGTNYAWRNILCKSENISTNGFNSINNKLFIISPEFSDAEKCDFNIKNDEETLNNIGFRKIPVAEIGLYEDNYRVAK